MKILAGAEPPGVQIVERLLTKATSDREAEMAAKHSSKTPQADVLVEGGGSLYVFHALSESAQDWVRENVSQEGFQPNFPNTLYVEHRYALDLAAGMVDSGLAVR